MRRRPGRALLWRDVYAWVFPWGFAVKRGVVRDLFVRVWPFPYVMLILRVRRTQVSLSKNQGAIVRFHDGTFEGPWGVRTMWGSWR